MTQQDKYLHRVAQGATVPSVHAIYAQEFINAVCDGDTRYAPVGILNALVTVEHVLDAHLHDVRGVDPSVTALIDPLDYYLYNITSPGEQA
jgi:hypothetical protein